LLRDELIEVCSEWNLTTREKVTALQSCMKNYEKGYSEEYLFQLGQASGCNINKSTGA
jgi:hypothetical protein